MHILSLRVISRAAALAFFLGACTKGESARTPEIAADATPEPAMKGARPLGPTPAAPSGPTDPVDAASAPAIRPAVPVAPDGPVGSTQDAAAVRDTAVGTVRDGLATVPIGPEAGAAVKPCAFALCESFEDVPAGGRPSSTIWRTVDPGITVDSVHAFRGTKALHIPPFMGKGSYMIKTTKGLPLPGKKLFGRAFFWIESAPPFGKTYLHWALVNAQGRNAAGNGMQHLFGGQAFEGKPGNYLSYNSWSPMGYSGPGSKSHPVGVTAKTWHCVEWSFDTTESQARFWWNGVDLPSIAWKNPAGMPQFDFPEFGTVSIGWTEFHDGTAPWEVWIDEIAMGEERIGCDR